MSPDLLFSEAQMRCRTALFLLLSTIASPGLTARQTAQTQNPSEIYKKASPSVVLIELYDEKGKIFKRGTGFLVSADGAILTNFHVVEHTKQATVRMANEDAYDTVDVLDVDKRKDIALVKIRAFGLAPLRLGTSSAVQVGDKIYTLTNPLGILQNTLSEGIISGIRQMDGYKYFQITAPISPGSSGGPVFNSQGQVIGLAVETIEAGQNLNFAVPIDYARGMLSTTQPRPLASIYEPEPVPAATAASPLDSGKATTPTSVGSVPDAMKNGSALYVSTKLTLWTLEDAKKELGEPVRSRIGYDQHNNKISDIFAFSDPTKAMREFELGFDAQTKKLRDIYAYPWNVTWDDCKKLWGDNVTTVRNKNGTRFHSYKDRHVNVLVDKSDRVISLGFY
jgi:hypothetical protein